MCRFSPAGRLCQCVVQAQLAYYNEFKNEVRSRWLEAFLGHEHLKVVRTGGRKDSGKVVYRGLSDGLRCSWRDYFSTMLVGKPEKYEVRYKVGTPDYVGTARPSSSALEAARSGAHTGGAAPAWAAASASRASNPYLNKPETETYHEYTELVEPRRIAHGLISIANQLAREWHADLTGHVAGEGAYLLECSEEDAEQCDADTAPAVLMAELGNLTHAAHDVNIKLPDVLYSSLRAASASWISDLEFDDAPSPFRAENFDLLQRATTREAALSVLVELEAEGTPSSRASALWLRERVEAYAPLWEKPPRNQLAGLFLLELLTTPPSPRTLPPVEGATGDAGGATLAMTEPEDVAQRILAQRERTCRAWGAALRDDFTQQLQELLAQSLEQQLQADPT